MTDVVVAFNLMLLAVDAEALYPNLRKEDTARIAREMITKTEITFEGLSWREMARYLAINGTHEDWDRWGVSIYIPSRRKKGKGGRRPGMTSADVMAAERDSNTQWIFPELTVGQGELKKLLGACLEVVVKFVFSTHMYKFGGKTFVQSDGGPIGLRLTAALAKLRIADWSAKLLCR